MSHRNRRAYPQAQYELTPQAPLAAAADPQLLYANPALQQPFIPAQQQYYQGGVAPQAGAVDQLNQGIANLGFQQTAGALQLPVAPQLLQLQSLYGQYQAPAGQYQAPAGQYQAPAGQFQAQTPLDTTPSLPLNNLYPSDLMRDLPPPIHELSLPPPPLVIPPGTTVTPSADLNSLTDYLRSTLNAVPNSSSLLKKAKLPFLLVFRPYNFLRDEDEKIPVVEDTVISRCRRCRSYINLFCLFVENGRRWRCNMCNLQNDVPQGFDFNQLTKTNLDRYLRNELNHAVVEFIAPPAYLVRTPQPLIYVFVIDVSIRAMQNGLLGTVARTILETLDRIPNKDGRTKVSFIGVDQSLHFFAIPPDLAEGEDDNEASLLVVPDVDDVFLPSPDQLLVNLNESRRNIDKLLANFSGFFQNSVNEGFALGPALKSAHKLMQSIGGKVVVFGASLPNVGEGKLTLRDEESVFNKPKESSLLLPNNSFYKSFAVECNKSQVTVDMFLASSTYQDVATLANLPHYTAGQTHFYPAWTASRLEDVNKLSKEISSHLSMDIELEAVMRVRGSSGLRMSSFYGNFFNRSSDLCSFPTFPRDQSYVIEVSIDEQLMKPVLSIQAAVLHTTLYGERRIRVVTVAIPVVKHLKHLYASADQLALTSFFTHKAIEKVLSSSFQDARDYLTKTLVEVFTVFKKELVGGNSGSASPLQLSTNLRMLPLLLHALSKNVAFRSGKVPSDHRANALNLLGSLPLPQLIQYIYPTVYSLHDMPDECGYPAVSEDESADAAAAELETVLPEPINASSEVLQRYGLYLINNGSELFLWVGGDSVPRLIEDLFGLEDLLQIQTGKTELPELDNDFNIRVRNIINKVRQSKDSIVYKTLYIVRGQRAQEPIVSNADPSVRELMALRVWALSELVEDGVQAMPGYKEYLARLREKVYN